LTEKFKCIRLGWLQNLSASDLVDCQVQVPWVWHLWQTHITLNMTDCQVQYLGLDNMFVIPTLPWTWLTIKFKCFRLDKLPSPNASGLACLLDPHYLGCDGLPSLSVLSLTSLLGPRYLGHGWLSSSSVLDLTSYFSNSYYLGLNWLSNLIALNLAECQVQVSWIWHICQFHVILDMAGCQVQISCI
jgi:hypothetical protein